MARTTRSTKARPKPQPAPERTPAASLNYGSGPSRISLRSSGLRPDCNAGNVQPRAHDRMVGGHEQRAPIVAAPGQVGAMAGEKEAAQERAALVHDMNAARAGAVDVVADVDLHAVGDAGLVAGQLVEQAARTDAAIRADVEGADDAEPRVVDIEQLFVSREGEPVGIEAIGDRQVNVARRSDAEDALHVEVPLQVVAHHPGDHQAAG